VAKVVPVQVVVVDGFMSLTADGRLTMGGLLGMGLPVFQTHLFHMRLILMPFRPEDMFGSLEVDANGQFVGENGNYQPSGMFSNYMRLNRPS
jgi:hypothetical protein